MKKITTIGLNMAVPVMLGDTPERLYKPKRYTTNFVAKLAVDYDDRHNARKTSVIANAIHLGKTVIVKTSTGSIWYNVTLPIDDCSQRFHGVNKSGQPGSFHVDAIVSIVVTGFVSRAYTGVTNTCMNIHP